MDSLYDRLGGAPAIKATVAKLYDKLLIDPRLIPSFEGISVEELRLSQQEFVSIAAGGPSNGKDIHDAQHRLIAEKWLSDVHFDAVTVHLSNALHELGISSGLVHEVLTVVETAKNDILGC